MKLYMKEEFAGVPYLDDRHLATEHEHDRHLEDDAEGVPDVVGVELLEALGAVAAHEEERTAEGRIREPILQVARLPSEDDRREGLDRPQHLLQPGLVRVLRLLQRRPFPPAPGRPVARRPRRRAHRVDADEPAAPRRGEPPGGEERIVHRRGRGGWREGHIVLQGKVSVRMGGG